MAVQIDWEEKGVYIKFTGELSFDEFLDVNNQLYGRQEFETIDYELWDFHEIDSATGFDATNIKIISSLDISSMKWNNKMKIAVVSIDPQVDDFVEGYKLKISDTNWDCELFKTLNQAREWIDISK